MDRRRPTPHAHEPAPQTIPAQTISAQAISAQAISAQTLAPLAGDVLPTRIPPHVLPSAPTVLFVTHDPHAAQETLSSLELTGLFVMVASLDEPSLEIARTIALDLVLLDGIEPHRARGLVATLRRAGQTATILVCHGPTLAPTVADVVVPGRAAGAMVLSALPPGLRPRS